ncbi:MAG: lipid-A-disaccharide synthase [Calditrichaeota bacterium]|nr:MAG: lipid-A-disaccharide synthase [Calditrichota bacterium]
MAGVKKILIIAGEASGDLHGGRLVEELKRRAPELEVFGIGGDRMQHGGVELLYHVKDLAFIGFGEIIRHLADFRKMFYQMVKIALLRQPDLVVLIDYPGFNLRFARKLKALGFPIFYYIAPQVWAWHVSRAQKMASFIDRIAVIFPFEVNFFTHYGIDARFVGHPLMDGLEIKLTPEDFYHQYDLIPDQPVLGLFPGSRRQEIEHLLPIMLRTSDLLIHKYPHLQIAVSQAETIDRKQLDMMIGERRFCVVPEHTYELLKYSTAAIVKSGTSTLEAACFQTPFCMVYKVSGLSYWIGKQVIKVPHIGLVNIVAGREIVREYIQDSMNPMFLAEEMTRCLFDKRFREEMKENLGSVRALLGEPGAGARTAEMILEMI